MEGVAPVARWWGIAITSPQATALGSNRVLTVSEAELSHVLTGGESPAVYRRHQRVPSILSAATDTGPNRPEPQERGGACGGQHEAC